MSRASDTVLARGNPNIKATHPTTLELTVDSHVGPRGDCIIGVNADKGCAGLSPEVKRLLIRDGSRVRIVVSVLGETVTIHGRGSSALTLSDPRDLVIRKSLYTSPRTLAVSADRAAKDLTPRFRSLIRSRSNHIRMEIEVEA